MIVMNCYANKADFQADTRGFNSLQPSSALGGLGHTFVGDCTVPGDHSPTF